MGPTVDHPREYEVSLIYNEIAGIGGSLFFSVVWVAVFFADGFSCYAPLIVSSLCPALIIMGIHLFFEGSGTLFVCEESITHRAKLAVYRIYWNEITEIEYGYVGHIVLHGENKRFVITPREYWHGKQKHHAYDFMQTKLHELRVPSSLRRLAWAKINKNVKVPKFEA